MKVLIVGAGAVGQTYARHLKEAGAEVYFFVKEKYKHDYNGPLPFYFLNNKNARHETDFFTVNGVITSPEVAAQTKWNQVYLCMSSAGLRGEWLQTFAPSVKDATIVVLQPGMDDRGYILKFFPEEQLVMGMISLISYFAPLPGEKVPTPGVAYWFPPLSPSPYSGNDKRTIEVVKLLNKGGHPSKQVKNVTEMVTVPGSALLAIISALEKADWSFQKLKESSYLKDACEATREAVRITCRKHQMSEPMGAQLVRPALIRTLIVLAPKVLPLDIETYMRVHFTKVGDQTKLHMQDFLKTGKQLGLSTEALQRII